MCTVCARWNFQPVIIIYFFYLDKYKYYLDYTCKTVYDILYRNIKMRDQNGYLNEERAR